MNLLTDDEIDAITDQQWDGIRGREIAAAHRAYARAIESAVIKSLAQGVSVEPEFKWCSVLQAIPEEQSYVMVCFGVDVVEGSYGSGLWLSLARGEAQPDYWAYHPKPPHHRRDGSMYTLDQLNTAIAAARVQAINECEAAIKSSTKGWGNSAHEVGLFAALDAIRALIGANHAD